MPFRSLPLYFLTAAAVLLVGCGRKPVDLAWWEGEQERLELAQLFVLKEFRLIQRDGGGAAELARLAQKNHELSIKLESLFTRRDVLKGEIDLMESGRMAQREDFLRNRKMEVIGKTFDELTTRNGRIYLEVSISSLDDAGVSIRHADGSARLRYRDLNDDQRTMFGLDAESSLVATAKERADAAEYERWIELRLVEIREKKAAQERLTAANDREFQRRSAAISSRAMVAANVSLLSKPASAVSSRGSRYSRRYNRYRSSSRYYYYPVPVYRNTCVPGINNANRFLRDRGKAEPVPHTPYFR